jgi:hypothetical protein
VVYVCVCSIWMLAGFGGQQVTHFVGLLCDAPADLTAALLALTAARRARSRPLRQAWTCLSVALLLYLTGTLITVSSGLRGLDPFPGPADLFYCAFYPAMLIAALLLIRAAAIRVPWIQLCLDATIFLVGFGTFFWFLVIRPAALHTEVDALKQGLSQA